MHRKIAVIDGELGFVGGINIIDDYDDLTPEAGPGMPRFDYAVTLRGPIVAHTTHAQKLLWAAPANHNAGPLCAVLVLRDNLRYHRTFEQAYLYGIKRAQIDIFIVNAYFLPGQQFRQALIHTARRGVRARVPVQGKVEYRMQYPVSCDPRPLRPVIDR